MLGSMAVPQLIADDSFVYLRLQSLDFKLFMRLPSLVCSATVNDGKSFGIIRRGVAPSITEYFAKLDIPHCRRKKSSSSSSKPLTAAGGAVSIARMASEKMV